MGALGRETGGLVDNRGRLVRLVISLLAMAGVIAVANAMPAAAQGLPATTDCPCLKGWTALVESRS